MPYLCMHFVEAANQLIRKSAKFERRPIGAREAPLQSGKEYFRRWRYWEGEMMDSIFISKLQSCSLVK